MNSFWVWAMSVSAPPVIPTSILPHFTEAQWAWIIFWVGLCAWVSLEVATFIEEYDVIFDDEDEDDVADGPDS